MSEISSNDSDDIYGTLVAEMKNTMSLLELEVRFYTLLTLEE
jgi:hypothetical protein